MTEITEEQVLWAAERIVKLEACIKQNRVQWEGMILAVEKHGTNLSVPFLLDHFQRQLATCDEALRITGKEEPT